MVVAPNLGASFAGGGGSSVAINLVQVLLEKEIEVSLLALSGYSHKTLDELHGTNISAYNNQLTSHFLINRKFKDMKGQRKITSSVTSFLLLASQYWLAAKIKRIRPDLIIFNDDVPRFCETTLKDQCSIQYVNFAFQTRQRVKIDEQWEKYLNPNESKPREANIKFLPILVGKRALGCDKVIANSSVTFRYIEETSCEAQPLKMYPPIKLGDYNFFEKKNNQIVAIGAFRRNKRFGDIINALHLSQTKQLRLVILGLRDDEDYLTYLKALVKKLKLQNRVTIIPNATRATLNKTLHESSAIISAAKFEPFGIAVVEAMGSCCVPIVYAGEDSGPWIDITQKGKYGYGFHSIQELSDIFDSLSYVVNDKTRRLIRNRALTFNAKIFRAQIKEVVSHLL